MKKVKSIKNYEDRIDKLLEVLMNYTIMDFTQKIKLSPEGDELDAIAAGLNTLAEELAYAKDLEKKYTIAIEESEEKFNKAFNLSPAGLTLTNATTEKWIEANESFLQMTGFERDEVIGHTSSELKLISEEDRASMFAEIKEIGYLKNKEIAFRKKSGDIGIALFSNEKILVNGESVIITTLYDITKRKIAEAELHKRTIELARSNQELEQFAYVASHDLQEPLRMITSYVQLIEKNYASKLDADGIDFIRFAVDGASRMRNLIYSLLDYSRVNRIKPFEKVNLNEIMEECIKDLGVTIQENKVQIHYDELPTILGDKVLLGQLFLNLISNAIKFKGKATPKISIDVENNGSEFHFMVKDNGIGIKKEYQEKIFVIFQRLHTKEKYPGSGIGLSICKKIVERHNGKIWVISAQGKGAEFHFTINTDKKRKNILLATNESTVK